MNDHSRDRESQLREDLGIAQAEARLYRGLFWSLLAVAAAATLIHVLRN